MARDSYRASTGDLDRHEFDRVSYERERDGRGKDRVTARYEDDEISYSSRRGPPPSKYPRDRSPPPPRGRTFEDDRVVEEKYRYREESDRGSVPPLRHRQPTMLDEEVDRRVVYEKERGRVSQPRPGLLVRRQSSLDTFDRRPARRIHDIVEESYERAPVRPEDIRAEHGERIESRPGRRGRDSSVEREREIIAKFDDVHIGSRRPHEHEHEHGHVRETEIIRTDRRSQSRSSRAHIRRSSSVRSDSTSSTSSSDTDVRVVRDEYPKKGRTHMPIKLVSERALIELGYPFIKEGRAFIVQVALGQENIDEVLKLSREYRKKATEVVERKTTRIVADSHGVVEKERRYEDVYMTPAIREPPPPAPAPPTTYVYNVAPVAQPAEYTTTVKIRDVSPARTYTTSSSPVRTYTSASSSTALTRPRGAPVIVDADRMSDYSDDLDVGGTLVAIGHRHRSRSHSRSHSRGDGALYAHIDTDRRRRHHHHHHHRHSHSSSRELIKAERLSTGELVVYEEEVERTVPRRGLRIEKDRKGRMSISVPRYR